MKHTGTGNNPASVENRPNGRQEIWLKASVVGGFWAALEIIIGSFLHNLQLPFAGSMLTFLGILITGSFYRLWPEKGLIIRAGIICALMKSVSPSAIILGPMIGILTEAILLEVVFRLIGNRFPAYVLGGILAMFSTLVHKLVSLLILYGMNLVRIAENLYYFSVKQTGLDDSALWILISIIALFYLAGGITAGWIAYRMGSQTGNIVPPGPANGPDRKTHFLSETPVNQPFYLPLLLLYLLMIPAGMLLIARSALWISIIFTLVYSLFFLLRYPAAAHKIRKPVFWLQLVVVVLTASFFLGNIDRSDPSWSVSGLFEGIKMCLRAMVIYFGFSGISVELRNPVVARILTARGLENLYVSISLAFTVLPYMAGKMTGPGRFFTRPRHSLMGLMSEAEAWLELLREKRNRQDRARR